MGGLGLQGPLAAADPGFLPHFFGGRAPPISRGSSARFAERTGKGPLAWEQRGARFCNQRKANAACRDGSSRSNGGIGLKKYS